MTVYIYAHIYICMYICLYVQYIILPIMTAYTMAIKTHDSESRGQEEAGCTRRTSVLFTGNTALKLVNALNKPP